MLRTAQKKFTPVYIVFGNTWIMLDFDGGGQVTLKSNEVTLLPLMIKENSHFKSFTQFIWKRFPYGY
jgi:hypothetical protein